MHSLSRVTTRSLHVAYGLEPSRAAACDIPQMSVNMYVYCVVKVGTGECQLYMHVTVTINAVNVDVMTHLIKSMVLIGYYTMYMTQKSD